MSSVTSGILSSFNLYMNVHCTVILSSLPFRSPGITIMEGVSYLQELFHLTFNKVEVAALSNQAEVSDFLFQLGFTNENICYRENRRF